MVDRDAARRRIAAAYDPELFASAGQRLVDVLAAHLRQVEQRTGPVLHWNEPEENIAVARGILESAGAGQAPEASLADRFAHLVQVMLDRGQNLHHPKYIGHQVPASVPVAGWFDAVASVLNQVMAIYEMGPWATAVEAALIEKIGRQIGLKEGQFAGLVTHGGSAANLTALLTARNVALGDSWEHGVPRHGQPPALVVHAEAHYCIARSAGILGLGTRNVVKAELDDRRRIDPRKLDATLARLEEEGRPIVAVAACACATPIGAFDPLEEIADICGTHGVWMHVDAAHGGAAAFSARHRRLVAGLERADSFILDAHKMMFMPALCAFVFYRDRGRRFDAFRQEAPYLFDPSSPGLAEYDSGLKTLECTKRAATFGLWGVWSLFGPRLFEDLVDVTFDLGWALYEKLQAAPDFEPLHEPQCNIVAFRHLPEAMRAAERATLGRFQLEIRRRIIQSGKFYFVPTQKDGVAALRATVINPLTTEADLDGLLATIRETGRALLEEEKGRS